MKSHKNHMLIMIFGCVLPLLLLFIAPLFGINNSLSFFLFIVLMLGIHLLFPMHSHKHNNHSDFNSTDNNN
ncbi:hypothetical protein [Lutibacter sp. HS1-25]|uniref:hypothetical protein n=1 Tax=Lutibacter sp. HS1-25 TaxID=2485000 RepID=UPI0010133AA5|nr:hypothetical protein [Lutibacter sp. HS1-25]